MEENMEKGKSIPLMEKLNMMGNIMMEKNGKEKLGTIMPMGNQNMKENIYMEN